jgi:hypothetical protein
MKNNIKARSMIRNLVFPGMNKFSITEITSRTIYTVMDNITELRIAK